MQKLLPLRRREENWLIFNLAIFLRLISLYRFPDHEVVIVCA